MVFLCTEVSNSSNFSIYAWKSLSWSNLSFRVSDIEFLHISTGLMEGSCGISSCVIWVRDRGGGVDTKSTIFLAIEVFVPFTFFGRPCCAPDVTKSLNYVSTETLFATASSMMSNAVANSSSSYYDSERIGLRFPFPFVLVAFFLVAAISFASFFTLSLVMAYSRLLDSMSPNSSPPSYC